MIASKRPHTKLHPAAKRALVTDAVRICSARDLKASTQIQNAVSCVCASYRPICSPSAKSAWRSSPASGRIYAARLQEMADPSAFRRTGADKTALIHQTLLRIEETPPEAALCDDRSRFAERTVNLQDPAASAVLFCTLRSTAFRSVPQQEARSYKAIISFQKVLYDVVSSAV